MFNRPVGALLVLWSDILITEFAGGCVLGDYLSWEGCKQCPADTYSDDGANRCTACPTGTGSFAGSSSESQCTLSELYFIFKISLRKKLVILDNISITV